MGESVHRGGNASAVVATTITLAAATSLALAGNQGRNALRLFSTATAYTSYAGVATPALGLPVLALTHYLEQDFTGTVSVAVPAAASGALFTVVDI